VGGAPQLIEEYGVRQLITSPASSLSPGYRDLLRQWATNGHDRLVVTNGSQLEPWQVLHPASGDRFSTGDDNAVVLHGEIHGVRVLLISDLGRLGQRALLERHATLRTDIIVTGLPAKGEPLMDEFLAVVQPQMIIISCARQPAAEQARDDLRERLARGPWKTVYVSESGTVTMNFQPQGCVVKAMRGSEAVLIHPRGPRSEAVLAGKQTR
jgi:beta-lactamase superfamily II metal-dependent hydrolase